MWVHLETCKKEEGKFYGRKRVRKKKADPICQVIPHERSKSLRNQPAFKQNSEHLIAKSLTKGRGLVGVEEQIISDPNKKSKNDLPSFLTQCHRF